MKKENTLKTRILTSPDGIKRIIFDGKLHSWDFPSIQYPSNMKKKDEYYIYGIQYSKDKWNETKQNRSGTAPETNNQR